MPRISKAQRKRMAPRIPLSEACERTGFSHSTLHEWAQSGRMRTEFRAGIYWTTVKDVEAANVKGRE